MRNSKKFRWLLKSSLTQKKSKYTINTAKKDSKKEVEVVVASQTVLVEMVDLEAVVQTGKDLDLELLDKVMMVVED